MSDALQIEGLGKTYRLGFRMRKVVALDALDLRVAEGSIFGFVGPNGAGKSTLLRAIAGLTPATGLIELDARPLGALTRRERAQRVALVPQTPTVPSGMTVLDYVLLGRTPYLSLFAVEGPTDFDITNEVLASLDLLELASRSIDTLSGGERQRVLVARALAQQSRILLLDEPTTALDIGHQQEVLELIDKLRYERGLAVISTMHDLTIAAQYPDRLALLSAGHVVTVGTGDQVLTEENLEAHYGATVRILRDGDGMVVIPIRTKRPPRSGSGVDEGVGLG